MGKTRIFLGRIPLATQRRDIEDFFRGYGRITDISLKSGFAFIEFDSYRDAEDAVDDLHGKSILGERSRSRSPNRSRHRDKKEKRSRSRSRSSDRHGERRRLREARSPQRSRSPARASRPHSLSLKAQSSRDNNMVDEGSSDQDKEKGGRMDRSPPIQPENDVCVRDEEMEKETLAPSSGSPTGPSSDVAMSQQNSAIDISDSDKTPEDEEEEAQFAVEDEADSQDSENGERKISLMDLPDDLFLELIRVGQLGKGLILRLSKKLERRVHEHLNFQKIELDLGFMDCRLTMQDTKRDYIRQFDYLTQLQELAQGLNRWSNITYVPKIELTINKPFDKRAEQAIKGLFQFNADHLVALNDYVQTKAYNIQALDFSSLLVMSANIREVTIDHFCNGLQGMDLCIFWKALVNGASKLESFSIMVHKDVGRDFVKAAFDVTIDEEDYYQPAMLYTCPPKLHPFQLYSNYEFPTNQIHFTDNLKTVVDVDRIIFKRITAEEKSDQIKDLHEIQFNNSYTKQEDDLFL